MRSVTFGKDFSSENITLNWQWFKKRILPKGVPYVWTNANAEELIDGRKDTGGAVVEELDFHQWQYPEDPGKSMMVVCPGGIGDVMVNTIVLRQLQKLYPQTTIVACNASHGNETIPLLTDNVEVIEYPLKKSVFENFDSVLVYEAITRDPRFRTLNLSDFMLAYANLPLDIPDDEKRPKIKHSEAGRLAVESYLPPKDKKWVAIQLRASSQPRSYPTSGFAFFVGPALARAGYQVFFTGSRYDWSGYTKRYCKECGSEAVVEDKDFANCRKCGRVELAKTLKKSIPPEDMGIVDLCGMMESMQELFSFYEKVDLVIGPDSACLHIGGALQKRCIALFGMMPHELRTQYYPTVTAIQGGAECSPCWAFGTQMPCNRHSCEALSRITPQRIIDESLRILENC